MTRALAHLLPLFGLLSTVLSVLENRPQRCLPGTTLGGQMLHVSAVNPISVALRATLAKQRGNLTNLSSQNPCNSDSVREWRRIQTTAIL